MAETDSQGAKRYAFFVSYVIAIGSQMGDGSATVHLDRPEVTSNSQVEEMQASIRLANKSPNADVIVRWFHRMPDDDCDPEFWERQKEKKGLRVV